MDLPKPDILSIENGERDSSPVDRDTVQGLLGGYLAAAVDTVPVPDRIASPAGPA